MRTTSFLAVLAIAAAALVGCGGQQQVAQKSGTMPDFMLNPPVKEGTLYGSGYAKKASLQLAKEMADLRAKQEIAKVLSQKVANLTKDFMSEAGIGTGAEVTELTQSITKSVTEVELNGCIIEKRLPDDQGGIYSLAAYELNGNARKFIQDMVQKQMAGKEALLSQFRAKQGFEELDKELEKLKN